MVYLDTSALVKRYVLEPGSQVVTDLIATAGIVATSAVTRAETAAVFSKAARVGSLTNDGATACHNAFLREWKNYVRIRVTEALVARADGLAWTHKLSGYDAIHLAAALEWQDRVGEAVTLCTFDRELWNAGGDAGIERRPSSLDLDESGGA